MFQLSPAYSGGGSIPSPGYGESRAGWPGPPVTGQHGPGSPGPPPSSASASQPSPQPSQPPSHSPGPGLPPSPQHQQQQSGHQVIHFSFLGLNSTINKIIFNYRVLRIVPHNRRRPMLMLLMLR